MRYTRRIHVWNKLCEQSAVSELYGRWHIIIIFNLRTAAFKAYCAIWVRRSNLCHQASPRVTTQEHPAAEGGTVGDKCPEILPKCRLTRYIQGSFTCRKATTWDRRLYFHSKGRRAEDFFALKIQRLRPGVNPRTWVPKASTLSRDHRSCLQNLMNYPTFLKPLCFSNSLLCLHHDQKPTLLVAYNHFLKPWTLNGHGPTAHILSKWQIITTTVPK